MPVHKICRICLGTEGKLYKYDHYELKNYYEQVMALKIEEEEDLPRYFCYECAAMLHKFHKFKEKCCTGEKILKELMLKGPITIKSIRNIDRCTKKLQSSLNIITVSHRVRTCIIKSKQEPELHKTDETIEINEDPASVTDDDNDDYNVKEELPPLAEVMDIDNKIEDEEENVEIVSEKISVEEEKIPTTDNVTDIEKIFTDDDERNVSEDDDEFLGHLTVSRVEEEHVAKKPEVIVEKKKKDTRNTKKKMKEEETDTKPKKFEITKSKKRTELDPNNWLKFHLSEDEAIEEFKARAQHKRFLSAKYKCNDCLKGFSKEDMLHRHVKLRHSESVGPIECRFCHMRFKWKCFLKPHMRQHYTKYKCLRCDLVCPLETTALYHEEYHNGVIRKCAHCGEEFKHVTTYYTHLRTHRSEHVCPLCGASFVSAVGLRLHTKNKHIVNADSGVTQASSQGEEEYCKRCDIRFETKKAYEEHLNHSAMHVDGIEALEIQAPLGSNPRKPRQDLKRLTRSIPTDCHVCGKHFATQAACRKHLLAEHPHTSLFAPNDRRICEICGISLLPTCLSSHLNTHTKEKLFTCNTCGRQFNSKGGMIKHQLTHSSEKKVPCTLCDKRFKQISNMRLHYRTFHLKEPYPKRNRKKKFEVVSKLDDYPHDESDDNMTLDRYRKPPKARKS